LWYARWYSLTDPGGMVWMCWHWYTVDACEIPTRDLMIAILAICHMATSA